MPHMDMDGMSSSQLPAGFDYSDVDVQSEQTVVKTTGLNSSEGVNADAAGSDVPTIDPAGGLDRDEAAMLLGARHQVHAYINDSQGVTNIGQGVCQIELSAQDKAQIGTSFNLTGADPDDDGTNEVETAQPPGDVGNDLLWTWAAHVAMENSGAGGDNQHVEFVDYMSTFGGGPVYYDEDTINVFYVVQKNDTSADFEFIYNTQLYWLVGEFDSPEIEVTFG